MLCEEVLGNVSDEAFMSQVERDHGAPATVDPVDFEWDELFKRIGRKTSAGGRDVGVRLGDWVLSRGLSQGDVLAVDDSAGAPVLLAVNLLPTRCLAIEVAPDHPLTLARVGWEVGNTHTPLFCGEGADGLAFRLLCPYSEPLERLLGSIAGVRAYEALLPLDPARRVSAATHAHHHAHGHAHDGRPHDE